MQKLKEKQDKEHMRIHMKCLSRSDCAKDCGEYTVIRLGHAVSIIEEEIDKVRKETAERVCDKMIGEEAAVNKTVPLFLFLLCQVLLHDFVGNAYNLRIKEEKEIKKQIIKEL